MSVFVGDGTTGVELRADRLGLPTGTTDPATATAGDMFYNTSTNKIRIYEGNAWGDLQSSSGGAGFEGVGASSYTIGNSITLRTANESYFSRTPSSGGNRRTWTWSGWVKRTRLNFELPLWHTPGTSDDSRYFRIYFRTDNTLAITSFNSSGGTAIGLVTQQVYRDITAWMHIVVAMDATQTTAADRLRIYVNGSEITTFSLSNYPTQNTDYGINEVNRIHYIGLRTDGTSYGDGYLANIHFIDGSALAPTAFGEFLSDTGAWSPIGYSGTYPGNSFHLDFALTGAIGNDASGAGNHFTPNQVALDISQISGGGVVYSSGVTYSPSGNQPAINAFDGSLATRTDTPLTSDGYIDVSFSPGISYSSSVRFYAYAANGYDITNYYSLNGGSETTFVGGSSGFNGTAWITAATGSGIMSSFRLRLTRGNNNQSSPALFAIEVDGVILTDKNFSGFTTDTPVLTAASTGGDPGGSVVGNYATLNPLNTGNSAITFLNGNLDFTSTGTGRALSTISMRPGDGKFYCEFTCTSTVNYNHPGIFSDSVSPTVDSNRIVYRQDGNVYTDFSLTESIASFTSGDVIGMYYDADLKQLTYYKNGSLVGGPYQATTPSTGGGYYYHLLSGGSSGCSGSFNFGQRPFVHTPPNDAKSLNTSNLPTPTFENPVDAVGALIWTGTGTGGNRTIGPDTTYMNFTPDLVWSKSYNGNQYHNNMWDSVRGFTSAGSGVGALIPDLTLVGEGAASGGYVSAVGSGTITYSQEAVGGNGYEWYDQNSSHDYIARCWNAGGTTVTGYQPSGATVACNYRANTDAGFSIISYTGPAGTSDHFVGHGLTKAPEFILTKNRDNTFNWDIYHYSLADTESFIFTNAGPRTVNAFRNQDPTALLFGLREDYTTKAGLAYIAYAWHSVDGLSSFGSYIGTGSADGPYYHCGFRPQLIIIKGASGGSQWFIHDDTRIPERTDGNPSTKEMAWETAQVQYDTVGVGAGERLDILANGFKIRSSNGACNSGSVKYCVMAWARSPFKYARAR